MVGTPVRRHSSIHRRAASVLALRAIRATSPVRAGERRSERRRLARDRRYRAGLAALRRMRDLLQIPQPRRQRRPPVPRQVEPDQLVIVSSDTSADDLPEPPPPIIDLDSSLESLPNIDPRPQFQLPVQPLQDLGHLDITQEFPPPLQHQTFREAYVLLQRLQLPPLQPITPPPELPPRALTPPPEQEVDWVEVEAAVAEFDGRRYIVVPEPPALQQPETAPVPQHVPLNFQPPQPMQPIDWAEIARALFTIAESQGLQMNSSQQPN